MQYRGILTGDASIAIFMTGMLGLGLVILRIGKMPLLDFEDYLFGDIYTITEWQLDFIVFALLFSMIILALIRPALLAMIITIAISAESKAYQLGPSVSYSVSSVRL